MSNGPAWAAAFVALWVLPPPTFESRALQCAARGWSKRKTSLRASFAGAEKNPSSALVCGRRRGGGDARGRRLQRDHPRSGGRCGFCWCARESHRDSREAIREHGLEAVHATEVLENARRVLVRRLVPLLAALSQRDARGGQTRQQIGSRHPAPAAGGIRVIALLSWSRVVCERAARAWACVLCGTTPPRPRGRGRLEAPTCKIVKSPNSRCASTSSSDGAGSDGPHL